jgi:hypothetical protein
MPLGRQKIAKNGKNTQGRARPRDQNLRETGNRREWRLIMSRISTVRVLKNNNIPVIVSVAVAFALLGGVALAAQNRSTLKVPNGLAFSEFKGYENWQYVAVSQTETSVKVIAANPVMIKAYREGVPGNGKAFPEGSKVVKIEWLFKKNTESPYFVNVPDTLKTLGFMEKDSKRFPKTHGWAWADFLNDPATDTLTPNPQAPQNATGATCGYSCHTAVAAKDYVFTAYPKR